MNWLSLFHKKINTPTGFHCGHCQKPKRCCDFTPFFPNFLIGATLEKNPSFIHSLEPKRLRPLGLFPPHHKQRDCDFFEPKNGKCLNWEHRPSECASYFCDEGLRKTLSPHSLNSEILTTQSNHLFRLELYFSQILLTEQGFLKSEIHSFVDEWNQFTEGHLTENSWTKSPSKKLKFYVSLWKCAKDFPLEKLLNQIPEHERRQFKEAFFETSI